MGRAGEDILEEGTLQVYKQKFGGCGLSGKEVTCRICLLSQVPAGKPCRRARHENWRACVLPPAPS